MKDRLFEALKKSTADYTEIRIEFNESTGLVYRGGEMESSSSSTMSGGYVRTCTKGGWGLVVFDSIEDLDRQVQEACECAALVGRERTQLADTPVVDIEAPAELDKDFRGVPLDEKLDIITSYNKIILEKDPKIQSSSVSYRDNFRKIYFASSRGAYYMEERPYVACSFSAVARDGALVQRAHNGFASAKTFDVVTGLESEVEQVAERALSLLSAPQIEGGPKTVILNPLMGGVFIHEAFGHLSEADFLHENPRMRELMHLGREMGVKGLNVVDDGSMNRLIGSQVFDDEGTPTSKTYLIKDGVLTGHLHSLETAGKMDEPPTGNARTIGRSTPPIVRMTNTYIENGTLSPEKLFAEVDDGVYACDAFGGQTAFEMFTFSAAYGYRIKNGKVADLLRDVVLTGNVFETLKSINGIANDLRIHEGSGGCGKGGQGPLPTSLGAPHIRIENVVIGGNQ